MVSPEQETEGHDPSPDDDFEMDPLPVPSGCMQGQGIRGNLGRRAMQQRAPELWQLATQCVACEQNANMTTCMHNVVV
jgi:hypothetical protein